VKPYDKQTITLVKKNTKMHKTNSKLKLKTTIIRHSYYNYKI